MKSDLTKFISLRNALHQERAKIEARLAEISRALGTSDTAAPVASGKRTFSAATKAKMAAAQKARWAKLKGAAPAPAATPKKGKRKMSAEGKANIRAAVKARWAKFNALKAKSAAK
ncbi:MAG: hypothetical protein HZA92_01465 [Verrucomicrobia bacterium]|nr:hypothetical protein [Verrucomicrobiota bacterium]